MIVPMMTDRVWIEPTPSSPSRNFVSVIDVLTNWTIWSLGPKGYQFINFRASSRREAKMHENKTENCSH